MGFNEGFKRQEELNHDPANKQENANGWSMLDARFQVDGESSAREKAVYRSYRTNPSIDGTDD